MKTQDIDFGKDAHHDIEMNEQGTEPFSFAFNGRLLSEILNQMTGDVKLYNDAAKTRPFIFREDNNDDLYLLMPLMV